MTDPQHKGLVARVHQDPDAAANYLVQVIMERDDAIERLEKLRSAYIALIMHTPANQLFSETP